MSQKSDTDDDDNTSQQLYDTIDLFFQNISINKSIFFIDNLRYIINDEGIIDLLVRHINPKNNNIYLLQSQKSINWAHILSVNPISFAILQSSLEPDKLSIDEKDVNNSFVLWATIVFSKYLVSEVNLWTPELEYIQQDVPNSVIAREEKFRIKNLQLKNKLADTMIRVSEELQEMFKTCKELPEEQKKQTIKMFKETMQESFKDIRVLDDSDKFVKLYNSIYNIHSSCASSIRSDTNVEGLENNFINVEKNILKRTETSLGGKPGDSIPTLNPTGLDFNGNNNDNNDNFINLLYEDKKNGVLERWYSWASQFWLKKQYKQNSLLFQRYIRNPTSSLNGILRQSEIIIIDDTSPNVNQFKNTMLTEISVPSLELLTILTIDDYWYIPPEIILKTRSKKKPLESQGEGDMYWHIQIIKKRIQQIRKEFSTKHVLLYSTLNEIMAWGIYTNHEFDMLGPYGNPINTKSLHDFVIKDRSLLGSYTHLVKNSTKLLTFNMLLFLSVCSGLPIYSCFGWWNVLVVWSQMIKIYNDDSKEARTNPDEYCVWLAREKYISNEKYIEINGLYVKELITRMLKNTFFNEEKLKSSKNKKASYSNYLDYYFNAMKDANIMGSRYVIPVEIGLTSIDQEEMIEQEEMVEQDGELGGFGSNNLGDNESDNDNESTTTTDGYDTPDDNKGGFWSGFFNFNDATARYDDNDNNGIRINKKIWGETRKEWMFGQRLRFEKKFSHPESMDELMKTIRIRFPDWCDTTKITINYLN